MNYELAPFHSIPLDEPLLELLLAEHEAIALPRLSRMWNYYRNALAEPKGSGGSVDSPYQRVGLPKRLLDKQALVRDDRFQREIVIENDIAWRIHTLVDFMFPAAPKIISQAGSSELRSEIEAILEAVFDAKLVSIEGSFVEEVAKLVIERFVAVVADGQQAVFNTKRVIAVFA